MPAGATVAVTTWPETGPVKVRSTGTVPAGVVVVVGAFGVVGGATDDVVGVGADVGGDVGAGRFATSVPVEAAVAAVVEGRTDVVGASVDEGSAAAVSGGGVVMVRSE